MFYIRHTLKHMLKCVVEGYVYGFGRILCYFFIRTFHNEKWGNHFLSPIMQHFSVLIKNCTRNEKYLIY